MSSKTDYGIDAPGLVKIFFGAGLFCIALYVAITWGFGTNFWLSLLALGLLIIASYFTFMGCLMIFYSKVIKLVDRDTILNQIKWRGDEHVLDVGCGRGLMLIGAAKHLTTGKAVGIDIWSAKDQSRNSADATVANAKAEGVSDRVKVQTADMLALPFADGTFDVVVSHWTVHNLETADQRQLALSEMTRVLKPRGTILMADIENRDEYMTCFSKLGFKNVRLVLKPARDQFLRTISFGSFGPATLVVQK